MITIPKATQPEHVRANIKALDVELDAEDLAALDAAFPPPKRAAPLEMRTDQDREGRRPHVVRHHGQSARPLSWPRPRARRGSAPGRRARRLQRLLDAVADLVRGGHRHAARHDQVELDERHAARGARLDVVRLDRAFARCRRSPRRMWRATSAVTASSIRPLTDSRTSRQPAHRMLAATSGRQRRIEDLPAGHHRQQPGRRSRRWRSRRRSADASRRRPAPESAGGGPR